ncbi:hypothetical protein FOZ63_003708 [Perkinsus olseni]|uniref:Uncharacterized protein n=1 Tax=Perkinsus olseni TaxID=32597 RepID=A0A7J6QFC4_PEROL|nr:hypothetical protein FOZ63_003708 [Perkinsus olseni]KAF4729574.1 hypothetical protein FOZ62_025474 [Perkinsus olseni]
MQSEQPLETAVSVPLHHREVRYVSFDQIFTPPRTSCTRLSDGNRPRMDIALPLRRWEFPPLVARPSD